MKILIIDDDQKILNYLTKRITKWGYDPIAALDSSAALKFLSNQLVDIVLLDVYLQETTAIELIPKIKKINPNINFITMTGQSTRQLELKIRSFGILYFMEKPIETENLKLILEHINERLNS